MALVRPNKWVDIFVKGAKAGGVESPVMLSRAGWAGFQKTGAVLWSSDIPSTFGSLQVQVAAGISTTMSGIPWWTTDVRRAVEQPTGGGQFDFVRSSARTMHPHGAHDCVGELAKRRKSPILAFWFAKLFLLFTPLPFLLFFTLFRWAGLRAPISQPRT